MLRFSMFVLKHNILGVIVCPGYIFPMYDSGLNTCSMLVLLICHVWPMMYQAMNELQLKAL